MNTDPLTAFEEHFEEEVLAAQPVFNSDSRLIRAGFVLGIIAVIGIVLLVLRTYHP